MKTQVLLSSFVTLPFTESVFRWARTLKFDGLELMPYRWTSLEAIRQFSIINDVPVKGIHLPFWARKKSFWKVLRSEKDPKEKLFACIWLGLFGSAHRRCSAAILSDHFSEAYVLVHPDTFHQMNHPGFFAGRTVYFENERPKIGEGEDTYNPFLIKRDLARTTPALKGCLMFDPGHAQIAQQEGKLLAQPIFALFAELRPSGLHLSFSAEGRLHDLPSEEEWRLLVDVIKAYPPRYIVVETKPGPDSFQRVVKAREMIKRDLGI